MKMKLFEFKGLGLSVDVPGCFEDRSPCIELLDIDGVYARISFCAHDGNNVFAAAPGCVWLKDWSENKDLAEFLLKEDYFELTGKEIPQQFVTYKEARIKDKMKKLMNNG